MVSSSLSRNDWKFQPLNIDEVFTDMLKRRSYDIHPEVFRTFQSFPEDQKIKFLEKDSVVQDRAKAWEEKFKGHSGLAIDFCRFLVYQTLTIEQLRMLVELLVVEGDASADPL